MIAFYRTKNVLQFQLYYKNNKASAVKLTLAPAISTSASDEIIKYDYKKAIVFVFSSAEIANLLFTIKNNFSTPLSLVHDRNIKTAKKGQILKTFVFSLYQNSPTIRLSSKPKDDSSITYTFIFNPPELILLEEFLRFSLSEIFRSQDFFRNLIRSRETKHKSS